MGDNIQVAKSSPDGTEEPRRKRIKLKFTTSSIERQPAPTISRPKRKSAIRVEYAENLIDVAPPSLPVQPSDNFERSSSESFLSSPPRSDVSTDENAHAGYGADFLANYIEDDTTPTPAVARVKDKASNNGRRANGTARLTLKPPKQPQTITISSDDVVAGTFARSATTQHIDPPTVIIAKLKAACQALDALGIPAGPYPTNLPPLPSSEGEIHLVHVIGSQTNKRVAGTAGESDASSTPLSTERVAAESVGTVDEDMLLLVRSTIDIFNNYLLRQDQHAGPSSSSAGPQQSKQSDVVGKDTRHERYAIKTLGDLLEGGVLNVNCSISIQRMHLMFRLYRQLGNVMIPRHYFVSAQMQLMPTVHTMQGPMWSSGTPAAYGRGHGPPGHGTVSGAAQTFPPSPHLFMHHASIAAQHQPPTHGSPSKPQDHTAAPHQFLFREGDQVRRSSYASPYSSGVSMATPNTMPSMGPPHLYPNGQPMYPFPQQVVYDPRAQALPYAQPMMRVPAGMPMGPPDIQPTASSRKRSHEGVIAGNGMPGYAAIAPLNNMPGSANAPEG